MSERYKTITFDDFFDGEQCSLIEPTEKSFKLSNNLVIRKNKIKLGKKIVGGVLYSLVIESSHFSKISFLYNNFLYILGTETVGGECRIRKINVQTAAISTVYSFSGGGNENQQFIRFKNKVIVSIVDGTQKVQYSSMSMSSWTNCGTIGANGIVDYKIINNRLYVLCEDEKIYYSDDGISFTLLVTLDSLFSYNRLEYLNGYLYVDHWKSGGAGASLIRISLSGEIQDEIISVDSVYKFDFFVFSGNLYVLIDKLFLFRVDGVSLIPVFVFENEILIIFSFGIIDSFFFFDKTSDEIIVMNLLEKFSRPYKKGSAVKWIQMIYKYDNADTIALCENDSNILCAIIYEDAHTASGDVQTRLVKLKSRGVPKQIVLRHKALTANAWVKVYVKVDQASSWGSAVINSNATNAVRKVYNFPAGTELDFIEFKIEYGTDDSGETPEDATLDFIYLPVGLGNAK